MSVFLVRHGECVANVDGVFAGQKNDSPLTDIGKVQAREVGTILKEKSIALDTIFCSPLKRAKESAEIIAEVFGVPIKICLDERLSEYDMGELTGTSRTMITSAGLISAVGAENPDVFKKRIDSFLNEKILLQQSVLIVTHAGVAKMIETIRRRGDPKTFHDLPELATGEIVTIDLSYLEAV